ncbi:MAG: hypothetical protein ABW122_02460 [Ilumatobacteraceae bacterium]
METSTPLPPPPPPPPSATPARSTPRAGQLTPGWRLVTGTTWVMVFVAYTGAWKVSRELGLATWWLGPISEPQPFFVMLAPFAAPAAMVVANLNNSRRLPWYGLAASLVGVAVGLADLDHVRRLAYVELAIAGAAALVSIASFSGVYRAVAPDPGGTADAAAALSAGPSVQQEPQPTAP